MAGRCDACGERLTGRQKRWCSDRCKKRVQRHPERYPELVAGTGQGLSREQRVSTVFAAANTGQAAAVYVALRDRLAIEIDEADSPRDVAVLAARLAEIVEKIDLLTQVKKKGSALDELKQRRDKRGGSQQRADRRA